MKSIRSKFIMQFTVLILLIIVTLSFTSVYYASKELVDANNSAIDSFSTEISKSIKNEFDGSFGELEFLANHPTFSSEDLSDEDLLAFFSDEGETREVEGFGVFDLDGSGQIYTVESGKLSDASISGTDFLQSALEGNMVLSEYCFDGDDDLEMLYVVPRTDRDSDEVQGIFVAWTTYDDFETVINDISYAEEGFAFVISDNGTIINGADNIAFDKETIGETAFDELLKGENIAEYSDLNTDYVASSSMISDSPFKVVIAIDSESITASVTELETSLAIVALVFLLISIAIIIVISNSISKPIVKITEQGQALSDLVINLSETNDKVSKDEIGKLQNAFEKIAINLSAIVDEINDASNNVELRTENLNRISGYASEKADLINLSVGEISKGVSEQAEDIGRMMEELGTLSRNIEDEQGMIESIDVMTQSMNHLKDQGMTKVKILLDKTQDNKKLVGHINDVIHSTNEDANKISEAVNMIEKIADQTSLLALNANIEAARAGEHGKGFAVVADEVRKLAVESEKFAKEIKAIVDGLLNKSEDSIGIMDEMVEFLGVQDESVSDTVDSFEGIAEQIITLQEDLGQLVTSSNEMTEKKDNIIEAIGNLSAISEENAATSQNILAIVNEQTESIGEVSEETKFLYDLVAELRATIDQFEIKE